MINKTTQQALLVADSLSIWSHYLISRPEATARLMVCVGDKDYLMSVG